MQARSILVLLALLVAGAAAKSCATCSWATDTICTGDCGGLADKSDDWCDNANYCCCENKSNCDCCCDANVGAIVGIIVAIIVVIAACIVCCCCFCPSCPCAQNRAQNQMGGQPPVVASAI